MFERAIWQANTHEIPAPATDPKWISAALIPVIAMVLLGFSPASRAAEWTDVTATEVVLIYPGQASLQWVLNPAIHKGAQRFRARERECRDCHAWNLEDIGEKILHSSTMEPTPPGNRRSSAAIKVRMRILDNTMQVRLEWPSAASKSTPGQSSADTRITLLLDDGRVSSFSRAGCWAACHADSRTMPADAGQNLDKYLIDSRSRMGPTGGGSDLKSTADLNGAIANGEFLEFWQATLNPGKTAIASSGYLLGKRHFHSASHVSADATFGEGRWVATFSRPLSAPAAYKLLQPGTTYTVGFAMHDQFTAGRFHLVSYPYTFRIKGDSVSLKPVQTDR